LQQQAERARSAFLTRDQTMARMDSLAVRAMRLASLEQENRQLRSLVGLGGSLGWGFVAADAIYGRLVGDEESTLTLSAGSDAGIARYSPVVAPEGLVGGVRTVEPSTSVAITWTHPDFGVSAMSVDGGTFGFVKAHLREEPERFLLELQGVAFRTTLPAGTLIVSSGLGGVYPRGIPIGTVLSELRTSEGWARTYLLRPAVRPSEVSHVMVLTPARAQAGVEGVWRSVAAADSAARRIAAVGDSIRRDSLAIVARRLAADSARRLADSLARAGVDTVPDRPPAGAPASPTQPRRPDR
ncbi:MAG TPA: rod shape-determining protein MreC, partial [Gemmatimonadales bacterium]|nr:rod shape-determining protein MreC [Gemmatimonadales bacterium]